MIIHNDTCLETLAKKFIDDILNKDNFNTFASGSAYVSKGSFLTGGSIIICESRGLQEYIQKLSADMRGIWTALSFKPLAGYLMQCAYNLSTDKKDENENVFSPHNLVWAIYRLLEDSQKTFFFANELASLFFAYQIYRPQIIKKWNKGEKYTIEGADNNFKKNEEFQRKIWLALKKEHKNDQDISQLYDLFEKSERKIIPRQIFIFAPVSIAPVQLNALRLLSEAGCKVNMYLYQTSGGYIGGSKSKKSIAKLRREARGKERINDDDTLYGEPGNSLVANLGRSAQVLYEQIDWDLESNDAAAQTDSFLHAIQSKIINDDNEKAEYQINKNDKSLTLNSCFSPLREVEVLCDFLLSLFDNNKALTPADIQIVSPNIENYANAIETVFRRREIPFFMADRDIKKHDKTAQLLNMLFSVIGGRYEAPDISSLFEYSLYVQDRELEAGDRELLEKWVRENAIRHGLNSADNAPNYSFKTGFSQLAAGFFTIPQNDYSENDDYCYPDIEGNKSWILGDFISFVNALKIFEEESQKEKSIEDWDNFFRENLQAFFGTDEVNFNEDSDNPYQKVIGAWDSLKKEILIGFGGNPNIQIDFSILKTALPKKVEGNAKSSYYTSGNISCSNMETVRARPSKVICCIGMNDKEYPRQALIKEISLMSGCSPGDKDIANEDRLIFLETICSAKENLYISWLGQDEKTMDELDPSSVVVMLLENLKEQFNIEKKDIITKHPLQPFSKKYFDGTLETYDNRWIVKGKHSSSARNVWEWRINNTESEEDNNIDAMLSIFNDTPRYFIKDVCNIILPEDSEVLDNMEPFVMESSLDRWLLSDLIIKSDTDNDKYLNAIKTLKRRGELPDGKFADKIIGEIILEAKELKDRAKNEKEGSYWIYPGKDKGKYRLKHWLKHLELNSNKQENQNTKMFLKEIEPIELKGMPKEKAKEILACMFKLKNELEKRLLPVFPDAAWVFMEEGMERASVKIFGREERDYSAVQTSQYAYMAIGDAESFGELGKGLEEDFKKCSETLFKEYKDFL
jgi:exodeoxyribonuclease V gamma subunit